MREFAVNQWERTCNIFDENHLLFLVQYNTITYKNHIRQEVEKLFVYKSTLVAHDADSPLYISEMGYGIDNRFRGGPRHGHRFHFVVSGAGTFNDMPIAKGNYFISIPGIADHYFPDQEDPWEYFWFTLEGPNAEEFLKENDICCPVGVVCNIDKAIAFYRSFFRTDFKTVATQLYGWGCFSLMLSCVHCDDMSSYKSIVDQHVERARMYIEHFYAKKFTVGDIADSIHIDERYLYNIFRQKMGMSPKQYLCKVRYDAAMFFLETSQLTIGEIASAVGFENGQYFASFFKATSGISPTEYRKRKKLD